MSATPYPLTRRLVRALRLRAGLTQEQLAEKAGLDAKYYQKLELGLTPAPALATLEGLGRVLGVKPWLMICDEPSLIAERTGLKGLERKKAARPGRPKKWTKTAATLPS